MNSISREQLLQKAKLINDKIAAHQFMLSQNQSLNCTCSIGAVSYPFSLSEPNALSWQETLNLADLALYQVKKNGRAHSCEVSAIDKLDIKESYTALINHQPITEENTFFTMQFTKMHKQAMREEI